MSVEVRPLSTIPFPAPGVAALSAACLVLASAAVPTVATHTSAAPPPPAATAWAQTPLPVVTLTAQTLPLPLDLINQQVVFNVGLTLNWLTTGAALAQRITQVPGTVVAAVQAGTSLPTALAQGLSAFADIEFEAGRDLVGYAQDIADFQLQFRATTLSAFPPFNAGPGQQFVVVTTAWGLAVVQQLADFARAVVTSVQQFTHGALQTPLPITTSAIAPTTMPITFAATTPTTKPTAAAIPTPKTSVLQQHSTVTPLNEPTPQHHLAVTNPVSHTTTGDSPEAHQPPTHSSPAKGTHRH